MAKSKAYELAIRIAGKIDPSFAKALASASRQTGSLGSSMKTAGKVVTGALVAGVSAAATLGVAAVKAAATYEEQLANVSTLLTGTEAEVAARTQEIGSQILKVSNTTGVATANLTDGMYQVISAFGDSADAAGILETAAKSAAAGNAETADSINLLSAVTKGYGDTSSAAVQKASDLAFTTVRLGQTTFPELAASMGKVIPLTSTLGVGQEQLFGAMATLTGVTGSTSEVVTQLKATMQGFLNPSTSMAKALKSMGYESGQALLQSKGFQGALDALKSSVGGNELAFAGMFSSVEAQTAVLSLAGTQADNFTSKTAEMYQAAGATDTAFARQTDTLKYTAKEIKNLGTNFLTSIGTKALPVVKDFAEAALPKVQTALETAGAYLTGTIIPTAKTVVAWVKQHKTLILAVAAGIGTAVIAVKGYNLAMGIYKLITAASATGTFTLAGAVTALNLPMLAVAAGIAVVVAAGILLYKNWDKIKAKAVEVWAKVTQVWTGIKSGVADAVAGILTSFQANFPLLSAFIDGWWQSISNAWVNVKAIFTGIISFIGDVFAGNWSGAWQDIVDIFGNVFGLIVNIAKAPINGVISAINWVLEKINGVSVTIPSWVPVVGGTTLGFDIPPIPALKSGAIATAATLAMVGEGSEPEAILPLSKLAALLDKWTTRPKSGGGTAGSRDTDPVVFSPVFNFYGPTDKAEAEEAGRVSFAEFKRLYQQMKAEERRKSFSPV